MTSSARKRLLLGLALPDCRAHSPNENFPLENLDAGIRINKAVLQELCGVGCRRDVHHPERSVAKPKESRCETLKLALLDFSLSLEMTTGINLRQW